MERLLRLKPEKNLSDRSKQARGGHPWPPRGAVTAYNLALPAGGIRRPHPRLSSGGRGCGSAWSLYVMCPPQTPPDGIELLSLKT